MGENEGGPVVRRRQPQEGAQQQQTSLANIVPQRTALAEASGERRLVPVRAEEPRIPRPPSYPPEEAHLYERHAPQPAFSFSDQDYQQLIGRVSALPVQLDAIGQVPGIRQQDAEALARYIGGDLQNLGAVSGSADSKIRRLMEARPDLFRPIDGFSMASGERVLVGPPLSFRNGYVGIPMYITQGDRTQFVMAYRSGSQGCWRRYVGADYSAERGVVYGSHYYKGAREETGMEDWQNFDHRIQQRLDRAFGSRPAIDSGVNVTAFNIRGFGANEKLVVANEEAIQLSMLNRSVELDITRPGNRPDLSRIVSRWTSGGNPIYGSQVHMVVESENGDFRYGITMTRFGMFVQYVENNQERGISQMGAPSSGVRLAGNSSWILTPVVEYQQQSRVMRTGIGGRREFVRVGLPTPQQVQSAPALRGRAIFQNLHNSQSSPFIAFSTANPALRDVYSALERNDAAGAEQALGQWLNLSPDERYVRRQ